jgi:spore germination cell wall hydrolase CwlJ-like protein
MLLKLIHIGVITFGLASITVSYQPQYNAIHVCMPDIENGILDCTHHIAGKHINKKKETKSRQNKTEKQKYMISEREVCSMNVSKLKIEINKTEQKNRWDIKLNNDEIDMLAKIVWVESRGECDKGQQAVVEVILNRMHHWYFKGSLYEVLSAKNQFSSWKLKDSAKPTQKELNNIQKVLDGNTKILNNDTVYFSTSPRNNKITAHIGGHYFCDYEHISE